MHVSIDIPRVGRYRYFKSKLHCILFDEMVYVILPLDHDPVRGYLLRKNDGLSRLGIFSSSCWNVVVQLEATRISPLCILP